MPGTDGLASIEIGGGPRTPIPPNGAAITVYDAAGARTVVVDGAGGFVLSSFSSAPLPSADDGAALGSLAKQWSDLFLASGAVINFNNGDVTLTHASNALVLAGGQFSSSGWRNAGAGFFGLGAAEAVTIATGVATVTKPHVELDAEGAGTTDQLDSIVYTGLADGDLLLLTVNASDTITVDDANINLGAATRAIAPGGCLLLRYDGTESQWSEVMFLAGSDNV